MSEKRYREKQAAAKDFQIRRRVINGFPHYYDTKTGKEVKRAVYFQQFANTTNYPFALSSLKTDEKRSLRACQRIKIGNAFIKKEAAEKIKYHLETKNVILKNNDAAALDKKLLAEILEKQKTTILNSQQTLKKMIERHKANKPIKVIFKGVEYTGQRAIIAYTQYIDFLKRRAEERGNETSHIFIRTQTKPKQ